MRFDILKHLHRGTNRQPVSPVDKHTIFNIFPRDIEVDKTTLDPGKYFIPKGSVKEPGRLVVGSASWWRDVDPEQPLIEVIENSQNVARSIVEDYVRNLFPFRSDARLGLFYLPGEVSVVELKNKHEDILKQHEQFQKNWYRLLVEFADIGWARSNGNPLSINEDMRLAASELGVAKDWTRDVALVMMIRCIACGALRNPEFPVCGSCKMIVDKDLAKKLGILAA